MFRITCDFDKKLRKYDQKFVIQKFASTNRYGTLNSTLIKGRRKWTITIAYYAAHYDLCHNVVWLANTFRPWA